MNNLFKFATFLTSDVGEGGESTSGIDWNTIMNSIIDWVTVNGLKLVIGILVLIFGFKIINGFAKGVKKRMLKKGREQTLVSVVHQIIKFGLKFILLFFVISYVGIDTAGVGVIISSLGVGISLAVQGSLSNFAGGLVILVMKPFKIGDQIVAQGCTGRVEEIKMFYTYVVSGDNRVQMIPNGVLANDVIINVFTKEKRRVDLKVSIAYTEDPLKAKEVVRNAILANDKVLKEEEVFVKISEYGSSSIDFTIRTWCKSDDYWDVYFGLTESMNNALVEAGIEIPYNKLDVNITNNN